ncbi:MAG: hypothetical protein ACKVWR_07965 [Acidimicrobiales bacterium]
MIGTAARRLSALAAGGLLLTGCVRLPVPKTVVSPGNPAQATALQAALTMWLTGPAAYEMTYTCLGDCLGDDPGPFIVHVNTPAERAESCDDPVAAAPDDPANTVRRASDNSALSWDDYGYTIEDLFDLLCQAVALPIDGLEAHYDPTTGHPQVSIFNEAAADPGDDVAYLVLDVRPVTPVPT